MPPSANVPSRCPVVVVSDDAPVAICTSLDHRRRRCWPSGLQRELVRELGRGDGTARGCRSRCRHDPEARRRSGVGVPLNCVEAGDREVSRLHRPRRGSCRRVARTRPSADPAMAPRATPWSPKLVVELSVRSRSARRRSAPQHGLLETRPPTRILPVRLQRDRRGRGRRRPRCRWSDEPVAVERGVSGMPVLV